MSTNAEDYPQRVIEVLSEISQITNSGKGIEQLLNKILEIAMESLSAERGFVLLQSPSSPHGFEVKTHQNFSANQLDDIAELSTSVVNEVMKKGEAVLLFEAEKDPRYSDAASIFLQKIQSIACVPLSIKNRQIGAIYIDSLSRRSKFTKESLPFLTVFANQAAIAIENAQLYESLRDENRRLREEMQRIHGFDEIIGQSPKMREIFELMSQIVDSDATVLIEGESGTGKELVARALHYNGPRKDKLFMALYCGSLPDSLLESELFGHKKGAFTGAINDKQGLFEIADGGTFFLDEIGDLSANIQTKLLRVLQEGEIKRVGENQIRKVNIRIISATNKILTELIEQGEFREDLYYRLNTIPLKLPPLRARKADISLLAHHFLDKFAGKKRNDIKGFDPKALKALNSYRWPGNIRELENTIERAVVMARGKFITQENLQLPQTDPMDELQLFEPGRPLRDIINEIERRLVEKALQDEKGHISRAADTLSVSRRWLHYKIKEWQL